MERVSPSQKVYDYIIEKILNKEWAPNQRITTEIQLSSELGASRTAIRQALDKLTAVGLLTKKQGSGTFVSNFEASSILTSIIPVVLLEKKELFALLQFRLHFESGNLELFMEKSEEEDIENLKFHYNRMLRVQEDPEAFHLEDFKFHEAISRGTRNPFVIRISELLTEVLKNHQAHLYENIGPEVGLKFHKEMLDAIIQKDKELAVLKMKRHIEATIWAMKSRETAKEK